MFDLYLEKYNAGVEVGRPISSRLDQSRKPLIVGSADFKKSFFVGDAAGRPGDHSDSDLSEHEREALGAPVTDLSPPVVMARNAGLTFFTPEQFFT